jgi:uncharacterized caspase-like protein
MIGRRKKMITKALLIGIDKYNAESNRITDLNGCVNDMHLMKETVTNALGVLPDDTVILEDQAATTRHIMDRLQSISENLKPGEEGFVYYAGHGGQVPNTSVSEEDAEEYDETLVPHDFSLTEPLLDDIFSGYLSLVPEGARLIIALDSCHSGGMRRAMTYSEEYAEENWRSRSIGRIARAEYTPQAFQKLKEHKERNLIEKSGENFVLLAAAQAHEYAWERRFDDGSHGIFTYHICEGLREFGPGVTPVNLTNHIYAKIQTYRENQMPRLIGNEKFFNGPLFKT